MASGFNLSSAAVASTPPLPHLNLLLLVRKDPYAICKTKKGDGMGALISILKTSFLDT